MHEKGCGRREKERCAQVAVFRGSEMLGDTEQCHYCQPQTGGVYHKSNHQRRYRMERSCGDYSDKEWEQRVERRRRRIERITVLHDIEILVAVPHLHMAED